MKQEDIKFVLGNIHNAIALYENIEEAHERQCFLNAVATRIVKGLAERNSLQQQVRKPGVEDAGLKDGEGVEPIRIGLEEKDFINIQNILCRIIEPSATYSKTREEHLDKIIDNMIKNAHSIKEILDRTWPDYVLV